MGEEIAVGRHDDPTAIVGLACRVPGAQSSSKLWDNIVEQKDLQSKIPEDRFNVDAFYHPNGGNKSTVCGPQVSC
jgi:acyl transferase domain-containing protein